MTDLLLRHQYALGDTVLMTALVRDLHLAYPHRFRVGVHTNWTRVWDHNPYIVPTTELHNPRVIELAYHAGIKASKDGGDRSHFLSWFHKDFALKTGLRVPVRLPKPAIFLIDDEKRPFVDGRYWVVLSGGKLDMTTKHWSITRWQEVIDALRDRGLRFIQVGATHHNHIHPPLLRVLNAIGRTENVRDLFGLIYHCDGVICGVTAAMHIAAAFDKPCVVLAGGREAPSWEAYTNEFVPYAFGNECVPVTVEHKFLHTIGQLDCAAPGGCWRTRTVPLEASDTLPEKANKLCLQPVRTVPWQPVAGCMDLLTVPQVTEAVLSYNTPSFNGELQFVRAPTASGNAQEVKSKMPPRELLSEPVTVPDVVQHSLIGGRFTVCVLCYGPYTELAVRCIDSIKNTMPAGTYDLRVACNACAPDTLRYLRDQPLTKLYVNETNRLKYPVMRDMFWDETCPITTNHVVWFDDDSFSVASDWLTVLAEAIIVGQPQGVGLYGWEFLHNFDHYRTGAHDPADWFTAGSWYKGKWWHLDHGKLVAPNGRTIRFVTGGWWCVSTDAIRQCDVPDRRLRHSGGDITIGAQLHQNGFKICNLNQNKKLVFSSGAEPRGQSQSGKTKEFPWAVPNREPRIVS